MGTSGGSPYATQAAIDAIPSDASVEVPSLRTLGTGPNQAMAGDSTFDDLYAPVADWIYIPASIFGPSSSTSPTHEYNNFGTADRWASVMFDPTTAQSATYSPIVLPAHWLTFEWGIHWMKAEPGTGVPVWRGDYSRRTPGGGANLDSGIGVSGTQQTAASPSQKVEQTMTLQTGIAVVAGALYMFKVNRMAADAADTLSVKAALLNVWVHKLT